MGEAEELCMSPNLNILNEETLMKDRASYLSEEMKGGENLTANQLTGWENIPSDQLTCRCYTPSGSRCNVWLADNDEDGTYCIDLNAYESGLHKVEVEWQGSPIPGSPFLVRIMQSTDEHKVRAYGPGLCSGALDVFKGMFLVDTKGGGPGALKVRVHGPKNCFKVEMSREHPTERVITVRYNPTVVGVYTIDVLWCNQHTPGSPFEVYVAFSAHDLQEWSNSNRTISTEVTPF